MRTGGAGYRIRYLAGRRRRRRSTQGRPITRPKGAGHRFEPATFSLGTLLSPLPLPTLPSPSSHLSVSGRPKTSRVVALEVGFEVGRFARESGRLRSAAGAHCSRPAWPSNSTYACRFTHRGDAPYHAGV